MMFFLSYEWLHLAYHLPPTTFLGRRPLIAALPSPDAPYTLGPVFKDMTPELVKHPFTAPVFAAVRDSPAM